jgi:hypothetical protein
VYHAASVEPDVSSGLAPVTGLVGGGFVPGVARFFVIASILTAAAFVACAAESAPRALA